jgi:hypothetical protein
MAMATNFRGSFDLFRTMWTGLAANDRQVFRKKVEGSEYHYNQTGQNQYYQYYLDNSKPHNLTSG